MCKSQADARGRFAAVPLAAAPHFETLLNFSRGNELRAGLSPTVLLLKEKQIVNGKKETVRL